MIFQQELNAPGFFAPSALTNAVPVYGQKTTPLTREERLLRRRQEKRRRQIQEVKSGCKRFMAMLFSHIGLSGLVIAYTIIGALLFGRIEQGFERDVKYRAKVYRENSTLDLIRHIFENFRHIVEKSPLDCNQTSDLIHVVLWYVDKAQSELLPPTEVTAVTGIEVLNQTTELNGIISGDPNDTLSTNMNENSSTTEPTPTTTTPLKMIDVNHQIWVKNLERDINDRLTDFIRKVIEFIDDDGWNGNDSLDDLKWSYAGAVLYAITVITTIGYGHATPKTDVGKFLTILYALFGIPLVFLYLSNIGDYLADVFRALYSRTCRTTCEQFCSVSLLTSIFRSLARRGRKLSETTEPEEQLPQLNAVTTHAHYKRRKRVLLKKICRVDPVANGTVMETLENVSPEKVSNKSCADPGHNNVGNKIGENDKPESQATRQAAPRNFYRRIRSLVFPNSPKVEEMVKGRKSIRKIPKRKWSSSRSTSLSDCPYSPCVSN